jgi:hypothetical protein
MDIYACRLRMSLHQLLMPHLINAHRTPRRLSLCSGRHETGREDWAHLVASRAVTLPSKGFMAMYVETSGAAVLWLTDSRTGRLVSVCHRATGP